MNKVEIPEILEAFRNYDGTYKRKHVDAAIELKDEIIPHLIDVLEKLVSDPTSYIENDESFDHIYAVVLLSHFGDPRAHQVLVDVLNMPGEVCEQIWDDYIDEFIGALLTTCGGSMDKIKSVIVNKDADDVCRTHAAHAMIFAVVDGMTLREEALDFFGSLFTGTEADEDSNFWGFLAGNLYDLYPEELMPVIEKAYQDELIEPFIISLEDFEEAMRRGRDYVYERAQREMEAWMPTNVHDYMSHWACFTSERRFPVSPVIPFLTQVEKKKRNKKKKKKKMAKASRRKNRR
ncbi:DUF1186 domain-containing protein [Candidatus Poribacteria bacterium]